MNPSLDGVRLKIYRAQEHLDAILGVVRKFSQCHCELIPEKDLKANIVVLRASLPEPPTSLGVIIGDFLYNVRSSLDHIVWQLVLANPPNQPKEGKSAFPICTTPENFAAQVDRGRLAGMCDKAFAVVESLQPYGGRNPFLVTLDDLHNFDKHRMLHVTTAVADNTLIDWSGNGSIFVGNQEMRNGAVFGNIGLSLDSPHAERLLNMKMQGEATAFVAFDKPEAPSLAEFRVDTMLQDILDFVRDFLFPAFEPFFN